MVKYSPNARDNATRGMPENGGSHWPGALRASGWRVPEPLNDATGRRVSALQNVWEGNANAARNPRGFRAIAGRARQLRQFSAPISAMLPSRHRIPGGTMADIDLPATRLSANPISVISR
jgi:hypothetical protein